MPGFFVCYSPSFPNYLPLARSEMEAVVRLDHRNVVIDSMSQIEASSGSVAEVLMQREEHALAEELFAVLSGKLFSNRCFIITRNN